MSQRSLVRCGNGNAQWDCSLGLVAGGMLALAAAPAVAQNVNLINVVNGTDGFALEGFDFNGRSGVSVASAGDINGDGVDDVVVGANREDVGSEFLAGRGFVVFGTPSTATLVLSDLLSGSSPFGFALEGLFGNDTLGTSVSGVGDVNGDGLGDFIVSAPGGDTPGPYGSIPNAGRSFVVFGKTDTAPVLLNFIAGGLFGGFVIDGAASYDSSGVSVSGAGDVNGDGLADLVIAVPSSDLPGPPALNGGGRIYVVFGKTGFAPISLSTIESGVSTIGFPIEGFETFGGPGNSVACAGDVDGDGLSDIIIGNDSTATPLGPAAGRSYVIFGKADGGIVHLSAIIAGTGPGFTINGEVSAGLAGKGVSSAGDVNGDGLCDLVVGADGAYSFNGRCYVVFGKSTPGPVELSVIAGGFGPGFLIDGPASGSRVGRSVSGAGDVNGDGFADVLVGGPYSGPGQAFVIFGKTSNTLVPLSDIVNGTTVMGFMLTGVGYSDFTGRSVSAAGDVDGDGFSDLVIGADLSDTAGYGSNSGRTFVVFTRVTRPASATYRAQVAAGNRDRQGVGTHRFGDDEVVFPDSRGWMDFNAGNGPGLSGSSEVTVTITRNDAGITGFNPATLANVQWQMSTNRTAWTTCRVTVRYTNAEIAGLAEGSLVLYTAPSLTGPFVPAANFTLTPGRNEAAGDVTSLPAVFVLSTVPPGGGPMLLDGDANDDGEVNIADVTAIHNSLNGIAPVPPNGLANLANIGGVSVAAADAILDHLANGTPLLP